MTVSPGISDIFQSLGYLFGIGMVFTIKLTVFATFGGIILGTLLALCRMSSIRVVSIAAGTYVNLLRAVPLLLVIFWFYFLVPYVAAWVVRSSLPIHVGGLTSALITFTLFEAAYYCEIMRAGIQSVPRGQVNAAYALGMNYWKMMRYVLLPQAFRNMVPSLLTQSIVLFQDTSLVYVLSLTDFFGAASKIAIRDSHLVALYSFAAIVYFVMSYGASRTVRYLRQRITAP